MPSSKILYILSFKYAGLSDNAFGSTCALKFAIQKLLFSPLYPVITSSRCLQFPASSEHGLAILGQLPISQVLHKNSGPGTQGCHLSTPLHFLEIT